MHFTRQGCRETPEALKGVEAELILGVGGGKVVWSGRAATSLTALFRLAIRRFKGKGRPEVILPAICCTTVPNTVLFAGAKPRFADVDPATGLMTLDSIRKVWSPSTCAVVYVHLFGQTGDLAAMAAECRSQGVLFVEDAAQSQGALLFDGRPVGSVGDACVYSFNPTKILESGGGALLLRTLDWDPAVEKDLGGLPWVEDFPHETIRQLELSARDLHRSLSSLMRLGEGDVSGSFLGVRERYEPLYLKALADAKALASEWKTLPANLAHRAANAAIYRRELSGFQCLNGWIRSGVCWRYSLLVDDPARQVPLSEAVRADGFHVSNLYWPMNHYFNPSDSCPASDAFARRILNLWVDPKVPADWVERCAKTVVRRAAELGVAAPSARRARGAR